MNRRVLYVLLALVIISCSQIPDDLTGSWIITEVNYNGNIIKPNTISENAINVKLELQGYENKENVIFSKLDESLVLPGIHSNKIKAKYQRSKDSIVFYIANEELYSNTKFQKAKTVFLNTYKINAGKEKGEMILISPNTSIKLINQKVAIDNITDEIFSQF